MFWKILFCITVATSLATSSANAQSPGFILDIVKAGIVKVIKAVDLKIQRLQNESIWLQNAQKVVENTMSKLRLDEIAQWSDKQRELYANYFDELYRVKNWITTYARIKRIMGIQQAIVTAYTRAWKLFRNDKYFTVRQLRQMENTYAHFLTESLQQLEQIKLVMTAYSTQMSDEKRLEIIDKAADNMEQIYSDLIKFNNHNAQLRVEVARSNAELEMIQSYSGLKQE